MSKSQGSRRQEEGRCPTAVEVRGCLRDLLARREFDTSERNRRFLSYVVEETLEGRADRIKAYNIALAAFDRGEDFDPLTDPIVRIEATRLRRALEHYYLTAGKTDRIRIDIPKGSYSAIFAYREASADPEPEEGREGAPAEVQGLTEIAAARLNQLRRMQAVCALVLLIGGLAAYAFLEARSVAPSAATSRLPSLIVLPFEDTGGDPSRSFVARALTYDVAAALTHLEGLMVFGPKPQLGNRSPHAAIKPDYTLVGSIQSDQRILRVGAFLVDTRTGQVVRSWSFEKDLITKDIIDVQSEVAEQILASIQQECAAKAPSERAKRTIFDCGHALSVAAK